jgi:serine/threonine protein kinase/CRP-like cAMP-binding protein/serine/threonine protein phosphatase PrpC
VDDEQGVRYKLRFGAVTAGSRSSPDDNAANNDGSSSSGGGGGDDLLLVAGNASVVKTPEFRGHSSSLLLSVVAGLGPEGAKATAFASRRLHEIVERSIHGLRRGVPVVTAEADGKSTTTGPVTRPKSISSVPPSERPTPSHYYSNAPLSSSLTSSTPPVQSKWSRRLTKSVRNSVLSRMPSPGSVPFSTPVIISTDEQLCSALRASYKETNALMLKEEQTGFSPSRSGASGATILVNGGKVYVAHVGDCRAVLGTLESEGPQLLRKHNDKDSSAGRSSSSSSSFMLRAAPLTDDHTPYRKGERQRVKRAGGLVMSEDQFKGKEPMHEEWGTATRLRSFTSNRGHSDQPRVWWGRDYLELDVMGDGSSEIGGEGGEGGEGGSDDCGNSLMMTRLLGHAEAEAIGVCATADITVRQLTSADRLIVLASHGVFQFMNSEQVVGLGARFGCPLEAAKAIVDEAHRLRFEFGDASPGDGGDGGLKSDLAAACLFVEDFSREVEGADGEAELRKFNAIYQVQASRPVPCRPSMSSHNNAMVLPAAVLAMADRKSPQLFAGLQVAMAGASTFAHLDERQRDLLIDSMFRREAVLGDLVTGGNGGDEGAFCFVEAGDFVRLSAPLTSDVDEGPGGDIDWSNPRRRKQLLFDEADGPTPSSAHEAIRGFFQIDSLKPLQCASATGTLWLLDFLSYSSVTSKAQSLHDVNLAAILRDVDIFEGLDALQMEAVCDGIRRVTLSKGDYVFRQGDAGDAMYVLVEGRVTVSASSKSSSSSSGGGGGGGGGDGGHDGGAAAMEEEKVALKPPCCFGERALMFDEVRQASCRASSDVVLLVIDKHLLTAAFGTMEFGALYDDWSSKRAVRASCASRASGDFSTAVPGGDQRAFDMSDFSSCGVVAESAQRSPHSAGRGFFFASSTSTKHGQVTLKVYKKAQDLGSEAARSAVKDELEILTGFPARPGSRLDCRTFLPELMGLAHEKRAMAFVMRGRTLGPLRAFVGAEPVGEARARFYAACVLEAIEALHNCCIISREITLGTVHLRADGYAFLGDLGLAKIMDERKAYTICGASSHLSPEMFSGKGYGFLNDIWALGITLWHMLGGSPPFGSDDDEVTNENCDAFGLPLQLFAASAAEMLANDMHISPDASDLLESILRPDGFRLGRLGMGEIRHHRWLESIDFAELRKGTLKAPKPAAGDDEATLERGISDSETPSTTSAQDPTAATTTPAATLAATLDECREISEDEDALLNSHILGKQAASDEWLRLRPSYRASRNSRSSRVSFSGMPSFGRTSFTSLQRFSYTSTPPTRSRETFEVDSEFDDIQSAMLKALAHTEGEEKAYEVIERIRGASSAAEATSLSLSIEENAMENAACLLV